MIVCQDQLLKCNVYSHLQEHMDVPRDVNDMSQDELLFHYFKMMDVDKNARLDGTELVASIIHYSSTDI